MTNDHGVVPEIASLIEAARANSVPAYSDVTPSQGREMLEVRARSAAEFAEPVAGVDDLTVSGVDGRMVPVRVYTPARVTDATPTLVFFHGGGWVIGSIATGDRICRTMCNRLDARIVSVEYRLAPEHPYPAAIDDAFDVIRGLDQVVPMGGPLLVAGESSGGSLAAAVALAAGRGDLAVDLAGLVLYYPALDSRMATASYRDNATGYMLTAATMEWFWKQYLGETEPDALASPSLAEQGVPLPPSFIFTAEFDPLRDEGEEFARYVLASGAPVVARRYRGLVHGFIGLSPAVPAALAAIEDMLEQVSRRLVP